MRAFISAACCATAGEPAAKSAAAKPADTSLIQFIQPPRARLGASRHIVDATRIVTEIRIRNNVRFNKFSGGFNCLPPGAATASRHLREAVEVDCLSRGCRARSASLERLQPRFDLGPSPFQEGWQREALAELFHRLVGGKARTVRGDLEQDAVRLAEVQAPELVAVDLARCRRTQRAAAARPIAIVLARSACGTPRGGRRPRPDGPARRSRLHRHMQFGRRAPVAHLVNMHRLDRPRAVFAHRAHAHRRPRRRASVGSSVGHAHGDRPQAADLVLGRHGAAVPRMGLARAAIIHQARR